ncbi:MAG: hypothetical protein ACREMO_03765, partial [Gemmatimonadales bacterium]
LLEALAVLLLSLVSRRLDGASETVLEAVILVPGLAAVTVLPGLWTKARSIEGIAGAAGIGLGAALVFLVADVSVLQPIGTYSFRWRAIGGGSNWWYHPVWWMVGSYISWLGAWILATQTAKRGAPSVPGLLATVWGLTVLLAVAAALFRFPGAGWNLPTFGVAYLPGLALATLATSLGSPRA